MLSCRTHDVEQVFLPSALDPRKGTCWKRGGCDKSAASCSADARYQTLLRPEQPPPPPPPSPVPATPTRECLATVPAHPAQLPHGFPRHSVSGFSSGGDQAIIHLVAFSSVVDGATILGGAPFGCQIVPNASWACSGK
eukprot:COSAG01_NODE_21437_length_902_cov_1.210461_2_plen_137_part_01